MRWDIVASCFAGVSPMLVLLIALHLQNRSEFRRIVSHWKDFPPHRHINGRLVYPAGMDPDPPWTQPMKNSV